MRFLLTILLFFPIMTFSQGKNDLADNRAERFSMYLDSTEKIIAGSKNQLDVYLLEIWTLTSTYKAVRLSYNGPVWSAMGYKGDWIKNKIDSFVLKPVFSFDTVFYSLKINNVFQLTSDSELMSKVKERVRDGNAYVVIFNKDDKFGSYSFSNPDIYLKYNKDIPEFTNYVNIVDILFKWLKKK